MNFFKTNSKLKLSFSGKNGKSLCNFLIYWRSASRNYPSLLFSLQFFMKSSFYWGVSLIHSKLFIRSFCDIGQLYELFTAQYWFFIFYRNHLCIAISFYISINDIFLLLYLFLTFRKFAYFRHVFLKFLNTSANNNLLLLTCKSWSSPKWLI